MLGAMVRTASLTALILCGGGVANAADFGNGPDTSYENYDEERDRVRPVRRGNSVDHAYNKLQSHGFYNIVVERTDIPYSFRACKRGKRYHVHIDENGELEELNSLGACQQYADEYDGGPRYSGNPDEQWRRSIYRRARHYY